MTTQANLYVDQDTDYTISLVLTTNNREPYPSTNKDFYCSIKKLYSETSSSNVHVSSSFSEDENTIELTIDAEDTRDLKPGKYTYDVIMLEDSGAKSKILEGLMFILSTNTRI
jgi:hypothetical protein